MMLAHRQKNLLAWLVVLGAATALATSGCTQRADTSDVTTLSSLTRAAVPGDDAPQLAHLGDFRVGVRSLSFTYENQPGVALTGYVTGNAPVEDRHLRVDVLYPADVAPGTAANAVYTGAYETGLTEVEGLPETFEVAGIAVRDASPVEGQRFPLIVVSHGFASSPAVFSALAENLVSKGYVVASIDHDDRTREGETPIHTFARVMLNRSLDQRRILDEMLNLATHEDSDLGSVIDVESIGLMGFSMGAYGVLNHAGAGYNPDGEAYGFVPGDLLLSQTEGEAAYDSLPTEHIDAIATFAPWGAQPSANMWTDSALADITAPMMVFGGSQDDVSNFDEGIQRIFDKASGSERYLVVFQNALHNLVQVPAPPSAYLDVVPWATFEEPVWRRERLLAVGAHFVTAFFDVYLKGDADKLQYLHLPTVRSNDAHWEQPFATDYSDRYADGADGSETYWRGFKRRQAIGLELHRLEAGESQ